ncbi:MAG: carboxymuconolactone decarboxylase family protein [Actinomycetota bacterium]
MADGTTLSARERHLVTIAALAATVPEQLDAPVHAALASGDLTLDELLEVTLHVAVYAGWPRASHLEMVVGAQWAALHAARGEAPPPWPVLPPDPDRTAADRHAAGTAMFAVVNGFTAPPTDSPYRAAVVEWVFGDLWCRPGLARRDRRLLSIACAATSGAPFALGVHVSAAQHTGDLAPEELDAVVREIGAACGVERAAPLAAAVAGVRPDPT